MAQNPLRQCLHTTHDGTVILQGQSIEFLPFTTTVCSNITIRNGKLGLLKSNDTWSDAAKNVFVQDTTKVRWLDRTILIPPEKKYYSLCGKDQGYIRIDENAQIRFFLFNVWNTINENMSCQQEAFIILSLILQGLAFFVKWTVLLSTWLELNNMSTSSKYSRFGKMSGKSSGIPRHDRISLLRVIKSSSNGPPSHTLMRK